MRFLESFLLIPILCTGVSFADKIPAPLEDVLSVLALTRTDIGIAKDYLPDPDRLSVTRRLLRDPLSADGWLTSLAGSLQEGSNDVPLAIARGLLDSSQGEALGPIRVDPTVLETLLLDSGQRIRTLVPIFVGRPLIGLVHPDSTFSASALDDAVAEGRRVPVLELLDVAVRLVTAADQVSAAFGGPVSYETVVGRVTIGTEGDDRYSVPHALIFDPGGNDVYIDVAGVSSESVPVSVVIDLAGDDRYLGRAGTGRSGVGILVDRSGNDAYDASNQSQASGLGGIGVLVDLDGDDRYTTGVGGQGFGLYGVGVLVDRSGDDTYSADLLAQGSAGPGGVGLLVDHSGDDTYHAGGAHHDFREGGAHTQSMSHGYSLGLQTEVSAGAGLLFDLEGRDRYELSYFGQGASHWAGTGALYDGHGDDVYVARRYSQGCGTHLSAGILVDVSGDDVYSMWGVGQGCGHDLAVGVLADRSGHDEYVIMWLGQGAGSANGTGLLIDSSGDDIYRANRADTQGFGSPARGFDSVGILLDLAGVDRFRNPFARLLVKSGQTGARYDVSGGQVP